jgi:hypothetical protein
MIMEFKDFNEAVESYYPLNKEETRYLIFFKNGDFEFYRYLKEENEFIKEILK